MQESEIRCVTSAGEEAEGRSVLVSTEPESTISVLGQISRILCMQSIRYLKYHDRKVLSFERTLCWYSAGSAVKALFRRFGFIAVTGLGDSPISRTA